VVSEPKASGGSSPSPSPASKVLAWLGVAPLGVALVGYSLLLGTASFGPVAFDRTARWVFGTVGVWGELVLFWVPLVLHAGHGLFRRTDASAPGTRRPPSVRRTQLVLGLLALGFFGVLSSRINFRLWTGQSDARDLYSLLSAWLSTTALFGLPWVALGFVASLGVCLAHFGRGAIELWSHSERAQDRMPTARFARVLAVALALLFTFSTAGVVAFATGSTLL
jgi:hypothetical protein